MGYVQILLLGALALLLVIAAVGDWRTRTIANWLNTVIALGAPLWWWAAGYTLWPGIAMQVALALAVLLIFAGVFAMGAMGGGDVKLLVALALWFPAGAFLRLLAVMAIVGGLLTLAMLIRHRTQRALGSPEIPYGIAIAVAGLWAVSRTIS